MMSLKRYMNEITERMKQFNLYTGKEDYLIECAARNMYYLDMLDERLKHEPIIIHQNGSMGQEKTLIHPGIDYVNALNKNLADSLVNLGFGKDREAPHERETPVDELLQFTNIKK